MAFRSSLKTEVAVVLLIIIIVLSNGVVDHT